MSNGNNKKFKEIIDFFRKVRTNAYPAQTKDIGKFFASKKMMTDLYLSFGEMMRVWNFYVEWKTSRKLMKKISKLKPQSMKVRRKYGINEEYKPHP